MGAAGPSRRHHLDEGAFVTNNLTPAEKALADHVARGVPFDGGPIRASVIRDLVRGRLAPDPDPHGVQLRGAHVEGRLDLDHVTSTVGVTLTDCVLDEGLTAADADLPVLVLTRCRVTSPKAVTPLYAPRLTANMINLSGTTVIADDDGAAVDLTSAHAMRVEAIGTKLTNKRGTALQADNLSVDGELFLSEGFEATGAGDDGTVRLVNARLGTLVCQRATLRNESGTAFVGDSLRVATDVYMNLDFVAAGNGHEGTIRLVSAHVTGLSLLQAELRNEAGPALDMEGLRVDRLLHLRDLTALGTGELAVIDLTGAKIDGTFVFEPARLEHRTDPSRRMTVDGLVYNGLPDGATEWLRLLDEGTPEYAAQPYQQLAAAHRAAGHDQQARRILMAQRRAQLRRGALTGRAERAWTRMTGLTLGYGYQPWRALIALLAIVAIAVTLTVTLGAHGGLASTDPGPAAPCTIAERIGVGLDLGAPLIATGTRCAATDTTTGQILTVAGWALRLLAWAFATLFIAGFTSAVRKT